MEEIIENSKGGKQTKIDGKMTEVPPEALLLISSVMGEGSVRYPREENGSPNWYKISCMSNLDHAMRHAAIFLRYRNELGLVPEEVRNSMLQDMREELSHFAARAMMALEQWERDEIEGD